MNRFGGFKRCSAYVIIIAVIVSCVTLGIRNSRTEGSAVTVTATNAGAPNTQSKNIVPNAVSDFKYSVIGGTSIAITSYVGTSQSAVIPSTIDGKPVTIIAAAAFAKNSAVTYIYIPSSVTRIAAKSFERCDGLLKIEVSEDNTSFSSADGVLYSKDRTTLIAFPGGVTGEFIIPKAVKTIQSYAFYFCYQLTSVKMYNNVTQIGEGAFAYCWNLRSLRLSDSLTTIGADAISHCDYLSKLYLPSGITSIGSNALLGNQDSIGHLEYYFVDGVYCVSGSYAFNYVKALGLTPVAASDIRYDLDTDIFVSSEFAKNSVISVSAVNEGNVYNTASDLVKENDMYNFKVFNIKLTVSGTEAALIKDASIKVPVDSFDLPTRVYLLKDGALNLIDSQLITEGGKEYLSFKSGLLGNFVIAEYFDIIRGDVDGDGKVTVEDARLALRAAVKLTIINEAQIKAADLDGTGSVDVSDARRILRIAVGLEII